MKLKRTLRIIVILILFLQLLIPLNSIIATIKRGDLNDDGKITVTDLSQLKEYLVSDREDYVISMDLNSDNKISVTDLSILKLILIGTLPEPDEEEPEIIEGEIVLTPNKTAWTNENVLVTINYPTTSDNYIREYSIDRSNWYVYNEPVEITDNRTIYARLINENKEVLKTASIEIENIDKIVPQVEEVVIETTEWATTNSITLEVTDNVGIVAYGVNRSETEEPEFTVCEQAEKLTIRVSNITSNAVYYIWIKDVAGNITKQDVTIENIDKTAPTITEAVASTEWGKTNSITFTATDNVGIVGYALNKSETETPEFIACESTTSLSITINEIEENGIYYVWVKDIVGNTTNQLVRVTKVDITEPTIATITGSDISPTSFMLTAAGADLESGIVSYEFYIDGNLYETQNTTEARCSIDVTERTVATSYNCYVIVTDASGNKKQSDTIVVTTTGVTAVEINENPIEYYGKKVNGYNPENNIDAQWQIFYADENNIYLTTDYYIDTTYMPNTSDGIEIDVNEEDKYKIAFADIIRYNVLNDLSIGTEQIRAQGSRVTKWISHVNEYTSTNYNMQVTAYLLDTNAWSTFADKDVTEYAIGGPTLELFIASYNDTHPEKTMDYVISGKGGYEIKWSEEDYIGAGLLGLNTQDSLYILEHPVDGFGYWIASPAYAEKDTDAHRMYIVEGAGQIYASSTCFALAGPGAINGGGIRPVVCLKSDVILEEQMNGTYKIVK